MWKHDDVQSVPLRHRLRLRFEFEPTVLLHFVLPIFSVMREYGQVLGTLQNGLSIFVYSVWFAFFRVWLYKSRNPIPGSSMPDYVRLCSLVTSRYRTARQR